MNKKDFADQIRARKDEIEELEELVQRYANKIRNVSPLLRANKIISFREGIIEALDYLDQKAQMQAIKRSLKQDFIS